MWKKWKFWNNFQPVFIFSCITLLLDHFFASETQLKIKICMLSMYLGVKIKDLKKRELFHHCWTKGIRTWSHIYLLTSKATCTAMAMYDTPNKTWDSWYSPCQSILRSVPPGHYFKFHLYCTICPFNTNRVKMYFNLVSMVVQFFTIMRKYTLYLVH